MPRPTNISPDEIRQAFADEAWRSLYPPVLTLQQFASLFSVSVRTAKSWIASGDFEGATTRAGNHRRIWRNRAIQMAFGRRRTKPRATQKETNQHE